MPTVPPASRWAVPTCRSSLPIAAPTVHPVPPHAAPAPHHLTGAVPFPYRPRPSLKPQEVFPLGILDALAPDTFTTYHASLTFRHRIMGGIPKNPKMIEGWLRSKAGFDDAAEVQTMLIRTVHQLHPEIELTGNETLEELIEASSKVAGEMNTNGFYRDANGLYIESRYIKSMLREACNVFFAGEKWGRTKKSAIGYFRERVHINPGRIYLNRMEPTDIVQWVGHVTGPKGPQSILAYVEYVENATINFDVKVLRGSEVDLTELRWAEIWVYAQDNGLGAYRSQGFGTFDLTRWDVG